MEYNLINYVRTENWFGAMIENVKTSENFLTSGIKKWEATHERMAKCEIVKYPTVDEVEKFYKYLNKNMPHLKITINL